ncbi:MAG TPA: DUF6056 family protein [Thermoanaerobaculia bacterium]|nr:DUF6056 family protein [Thermoanaerobaculia bacterium]
MSRALRVSGLVLSIALLAGIATYAWRGGYARYFLDDFCTAADLQQYGFAGAMQHHRESWSGRYSYFVFKAALESIGPVTARVTPALMLLLLGVSFWWTLRRVIAERTALAVAVLACTFTLFDASPSMLNEDQTYFWETGYVTYVLPLVLFTLWLGLFAGTKASPARAAAASAVLMLVAGGLSETSLACQGALSGGLLIVSLILRNRRGIWISASAVMATLVSLAIVASAPGNAVRANTLQTHFTLPEAALRALRHANGFVGSYLFLAGAAFLVVIGAGLLAGFVSPRMRTRVALACALVAFGAYLVTFFPSAWLIPTPPPPASLDVASYCLLLAFFAAAAAAGRSWANGARVLPALLLVLTIVPLWSVAANVRMLPSDRDKAARMDALDTMLRTRRGQDVALREPWFLSRHLLETDPGHWRNQCMSRYYDLRSLRIIR